MKTLGRQTRVVMTDEDEREFVAFLRSTADVMLIESAAPSKDLMWADYFLPREQDHWQYFIWNRAFSWEPRYGRVAMDAVVRERAGWYFLADPCFAPVIEYDRHNFASHDIGRVYWAKDFGASGRPAYDASGFSKWFNQVVRWIRKNGRQRCQEAYAPYFLPDAWKRYLLLPDPWPYQLDHGVGR